MIATMRTIIAALLLILACDSAPSQPDATVDRPNSAQMLAELICKYGDKCGLSLDSGDCVAVVEHCGAPALTVVIDACFPLLDCAETSECLDGLNCAP